MAFEDDYEFMRLKLAEVFESVLDREVCSAQV